MKLTKQMKDFYNIFAQHGGSKAKVVLDPKEVALLIHISNYDLTNALEEDWYYSDIKPLLTKNYFDISSDDIKSIEDISIEEACELLIVSNAINPTNIIYLYLKNLCDLHRRRFKYRKILSTQPFPSVEQIGPRSLIEYGNSEDALLFNWLHWRKWIYDIDNRSAQETGYIFEPILSSCLGGESRSHTNSPIKRLDDSGNITIKGRQIDCYIDDGVSKYAYELKMRVTIAASGQGRFNEEMSFPIEAKASGVKPILVVFDSTESTLLLKLIKQYEENNGAVYIGSAAWDLLEKDAGEQMGKFIEKYIEPPINAMINSTITTPSNITLSATEDNISIKDGQGNEYLINRENNH